MRIFTHLRKKFVLLAMVLGLVLVPVVSSGVPVLAQSAQNEVCQGFGAAGGSCQGNAASGSLNKTIASIINILSFVAGFAAVIMIIISGLKFITAQGDASGVASARSALIYAIVGLVVVALAQFIVHFVLGRVGK